MTAEFYGALGWETSSGPMIVVQVHENDCWPVADNSGSGTKDELADGLHPVIAIGGRTTADGRPENVTGVVISVFEGLTEPLDLVQVNIATGYIVKNYVANILTYDGQGAPATFETAPVPGQPVYVDDSADLAEGVTLSMSALNEGGLPNPLAGYLWYCQTEYADAAVGGPNAAATFDIVLANELVQQAYCILLTSDSGQSCCEVA